MSFVFYMRFKCTTLPPDLFSPCGNSVKKNHKKSGDWTVITCVAIKVHDHYTTIPVDLPKVKIDWYDQHLDSHGKPLIWGIKKKLKNVSKNMIKVTPNWTKILALSNCRLSLPISKNTLLLFNMDCG